MGTFLDDLCRVAKAVELPNGKRLRIRALSDTEQRERDLEALRVSAVFQKALRNEDSREYQAILLPFAESTPEEKRNALTAYRMLSAVREAAQNIRPRFIPFPDNASEDERRDVLNQRLEQMTKITEQRRAETERLVEETKRQVADLNGDGLSALLRKHAISASADGLYTDEFVNQTIYLASETEDGSARFYASPQVVRSLHAKVRNKLFDEYLEVDAVDPFLLTLPPATESSTA